MKKYLGLAKYIVIGLLGLLAMFSFGVSSFVLLFTLGIILIVDGLVNIAASFRNNFRDDWLGMVEGAISAIIGVTILIVPDVAFSFIIYLLATLAVFYGVIEANKARKSSKKIWKRLLFLAAGIICILLGLWIFANPLNTGVATMFVVGIFLVFYSVYNIVM